MFIEDTCVQPINFPATFTIWLRLFLSLRLMPPYQAIKEKVRTDSIKDL
jgi:hypothetical protein